ncbi:MAG: nucleotidyl transferase AbiEii/AbiGii toxin family protein [Candidatus Marinimicrobia bacterium]|nr:nucleotidyl transferase AbiEii/AbiGii toxin family protein [Candidatus Neomarinimicrobiota bacterium]
MNLHLNKRLFGEMVSVVAQDKKINPVFIEKDYWISYVLNQLSKSEYAVHAVFKGGTSLSKGYQLIDRFSEDIDIAIIESAAKSGNPMRKLIRHIEKIMTVGLTEVTVDGITAKKGKNRKTVHEYESGVQKNKKDKLIVEINAFANPFPYELKNISSFIHDFIVTTDRTSMIDEFELNPFKINVLSKNQTLLEKLVSLIRHSQVDNYIPSIASKIRHFYDIYFLLNDKDCKSFIHSNEFKKRFFKLLEHDKDIFDEPISWSERPLLESPLLVNFDFCWKSLKRTYSSELSQLAYSEIPNEKAIFDSFKKLLDIIS